MYNGNAARFAFIYVISSESRPHFSIVERGKYIGR